MNKLTKEQEYEYVKRAQNGDKHSFEYIFNQYHHVLNFKMRGMFLDADKAEDITMEVFEKAFENLHKYQPTYKFGVWLVKLASNYAISAIRKQSISVMGNITRYSNDTDENDNLTNIVFRVKDNNPTPEEEICNEQLNLYVRSRVNMLPPRAKRVIELRYFDGLDNESISKTLGISNNTTRMYISKAMFSLKEIFITDKRNNTFY